MDKNKKIGIAYLLGSSFSFGLMSLFVKLAGNVPAMEKVVFRNGLTFFFILFVMLKNHEKIEVKKENLKYLIARSVFGTMGVVCNFYAVDHLVLADASMLSKLSPFFAILASYFLLKEKFSTKQILAVIGAFVGALFIIKPTGDVLNVPAMVAMLGGLGAGIAYTMVRVLGQHGVKGNIIILFFSGFCTLVCLPFTIAVFQPLTAYQIAMMICVGIAATAGQFCVTRAYIHAPAKEISVFDYSQIIFSAMLGFFVLGQVPDLYSVIGYVIICSMGVWMFFNNR